MENFEVIKALFLGFVEGLTEFYQFPVLAI